MKELTQKQKETLDFIRDKGPLLNISSIAKNFGLSYNSALHRVTGLYKKKYITMEKSELVNCFEFRIVKEY